MCQPHMSLLRVCCLEHEQKRIQSAQLGMCLWQYCHTVVCENLVLQEVLSTYVWIRDYSGYYMFQPGCGMVQSNGWDHRTHLNVHIMCSLPLTWNMRTPSSCWSNLNKLSKWLVAYSALLGRVVISPSSSIQNGSLASCTMT